jgi:cytochrome c peroxidase
LDFYIFVGCMSFKRHVDEIRSRTSISQTHIIHMRLGLTGIWETAVQPQALRRARRPAGIGAMLSMALAALTMTLAACDAGSPAAGGKANASGNAQVNAKADLNASADASVEAQANASPASGPMAASAVKVGAHEAGQTRAQVYESVRQMTALGKQLFFDASLSDS